MKKAIITVLSSFLLVACTSDERDNILDSETNNTINICLDVEGFEWEDLTRTTATVTNTGIQYAWTSKDTISIYPDTGSQVEFIAKSSEKSETSTSFDGGAWKLKEGHTFCAFYPYSFRNRTCNNILLDYTGQTQTENGNISDACKKDYIYASSTCVESGIAKFTFKHLGAFLYLELSMPNGGFFSEVRLCTHDKVFPTRQILDLSSGEPDIKTLEMSSECILELSNVYVEEDNATLTVALMMPEADFSDQNIYISATDSEGCRYSSINPLQNQKFLQGKAYRRICQMSKEGSDDYIDTQRYEIKLFSIGNSYACDALAYVPLLIEEALPNADVHIAIAFQVACSLEDHLQKMEQDTPFYHFFEYKTDWKKWDYHNYDAPMSSFLMSDNWDIFTMQQYSGWSYDYTTYQPYLNTIVSDIKAIYPKSEIVWIETHSYADGYKNIFSDEMFLGIADATKIVIEETEIKKIIPYGAAIQNARHTVLDEIGVYNGTDGINHGHLSYEGSHLFTGLPRLIASYVSAQVILDLYGINISIIENSELILDANTDKKIDSPGCHGTFKPLPENYYQIGKQCAEKALTNPFVISIIDNGNCGTGTIEPSRWK